MLHADGSICPPTVHILSRLTAPPYLGSVTTRPFYRGADAATAVARLGLLPSVAYATRVMVVWEYLDLAVALQLDRDAPTGLVVLDASMSSHTVRWHPYRLKLGQSHEDGVRSTLPEWGQPVRHDDVGLPGPIADLLALWREFRRGDLRQTRTELAEAGFIVRWTTDHG